ncbi:hypothetical protein SprV_0200562700 [Sparganum proliferum]
MIIQAVEEDVNEDLPDYVQLGDAVWPCGGQPYSVITPPTDKSFSRSGKLICDFVSTSEPPETSISHLR